MIFNPDEANWLICRECKNDISFWDDYYGTCPQCKILKELERKEDEMRNNELTERKQ